MSAAARQFADTSFWIALTSARDDYHAAALRWNLAAIRSSITIVTTEAVLWEWLNACAAPALRLRAAEAYRRIQSDRRIVTVGFEQKQTSEALSLYESRTDKAWSMTDCFSFVVMRDRGIMAALSSDRHFEQAGFVPLLRHEPPQ